MSKNKKIIFIASTGGHLSELLQLSDLFKKYEYLLVTEKTKNNLHLKEKYNTKFLMAGTKSHPFRYFFVCLVNPIKSLFYFLKFKPDVVITTGAHTSVPMCFIAHLFKKKVIYIETMANRHTKTMTGKMLYKIADHFVVQWEEMKELYPKAKYGGLIY